MGLRDCMYMYVVEANFCYLFGCILKSEDCFFITYIFVPSSGRSSLRLCITRGVFLSILFCVCTSKYSF